MVASWHKLLLKLTLIGCAIKDRHSNSIKYYVWIEHLPRGNIVLSYFEVLWYTLEYFEILWRTLKSLQKFSISIILNKRKTWYSCSFSTLKYFDVLWSTSKYFDVVLCTSKYFGVLWRISMYFEVLSKAFYKYYLEAFYVAFQILRTALLYLNVS